MTCVSGVKSGGKVGATALISSADATKVDENKKDRGQLWTDASLAKARMLLRYGSLNPFVYRSSVPLMALEEILTSWIILYYSYSYCSCILYTHRTVSSRLFWLLCRCWLTPLSVKWESVSSHRTLQKRKLWFPCSHFFSIVENRTEREDPGVTLITIEMQIICPEKWGFSSLGYSHGETKIT